MSLETDVANLVTQTTKLLDYFGNKKAAIDSAVAAAIAAIPEGRKIFYVNQLTGDDNADGQAARPLKTIDKAIANTPFGGLCIVRLQTDYRMALNISVDARVLSIFSDTTGVKRKIIPAYYMIADGTAHYLSGIVQSNGAQVLLSDITVDLPSPAGLNPAPVGFVNAFFKSTSNGGAVILAAKLSACEFTSPPDGTAYLVGAPNSAVVLEVLGTSFPASFGGRYISGIAAGSLPKDIPNIMTNLTVL
ncbi:hypothetical protein LU676_18410 [Pseudomonas alloputida]|uniref:hypothetical protein n=1 Tax=Pseudomonas putida group TaxID=136845 RepID=UPI001E57E0E0|nr:hypothetical protein [Pseudomonas alloputida]MCE0904716.1 hypothetical protein [Pseudomonas alloputida]